MIVTTLALSVTFTPAAASSGACNGANERTDLVRRRHATQCLINRARAAHALRRLTGNAALTLAAGRHARDMVRRSYFEHTSPGGSTPVGRTRRAGYHGARIGEVIQFGIGRDATPSGAVRGWLGSAPHRSILLDGSMREFGVGVANGRPLHLRGAAAGATTVVDFGYTRIQAKDSTLNLRTGSDPAGDNFYRGNVDGSYKINANMVALSVRLRM